MLANRRDVKDLFILQRFPPREGICGLLKLSKGHRGTSNSLQLCPGSRRVELSWLLLPMHVQRVSILLWNNVNRDNRKIISKGFHSTRFKGFPLQQCWVLPFNGIALGQLKLLWTSAAEKRALPFSDCWQAGHRQQQYELCSPILILALLRGLFLGRGLELVPATRQSRGFLLVTVLV